MPCDSIIINSVELSVADGGLLKEALERLGAYGVSISGTNAVFSLDGHTFTLAGGRLSSQGSRRSVVTEQECGAVADRLKQAYSVRSVYQSAKRMGWTVKEVSPNKLQVIRRF